MLSNFYTALNRFREKYGLSSSTLKLFACLSMLIDHSGATVVKALIRAPYVISVNGLPQKLSQLYHFMRAFGRLAFPIYCFFLVEGFLHTRSAARYAKRLFLFALISEIPFDYALKSGWFFPQKQNVYFTLLFGLLGIWAVSVCQGQTVIQLMALVAAMSAASLLRTDYGLKGVFLIQTIYILRFSRFFQCLGGAAAISWENYAPLAFIGTFFYNGKRGLSLKYFFYVFYPAHLLLLGIITRCILPRLG